jgi:hypothetical protein
MMGRGLKAQSVNGERKGGRDGLSAAGRACWRVVGRVSGRVFRRVFVFCRVSRRRGVVAVLASVAALSATALWLPSAQAQVPASSPVAVDPFTAGRDSMASGDPAAAAQQYERALQANPDDPVALNNLAVARANNGDYQAALDLMKRAAAAAPDRADIAANLAQYRKWLDQRANVRLQSPGEDSAPLSDDSDINDIPPLWSPSDTAQMAPSIPADDAGAGDPVAGVITGKQ